MNTTTTKKMIKKEELDSFISVNYCDNSRYWELYKYITEKITFEIWDHYDGSFSLACTITKAYGDNPEELFQMACKSTGFSADDKCRYYEEGHKLLERLINSWVYRALTWKCDQNDLAENLLSEELLDCEEAVKKIGGYTSGGNDSDGMTTIYWSSRIFKRKYPYNLWPFKFKGTLQEYFRLP